MAEKLATFKWFTDNYTRGSWETGVSNTIFVASTTNVTATSNKAINYNDLRTPTVYNYNSKTIGAAKNQCVTQTDITNVMRTTNYTIHIERNNSNNKILSFWVEDFDTSPTTPSDGYLKIKINVFGTNGSNGTTTTSYNVDVHVSSTTTTKANITHTYTISGVEITNISVFRANALTEYIVKPQITFNYSANLALLISSPASNMATLGTTFTPSGGGESGGGSGSGGTTGTQLVIQSTWKSLQQALNDDSFFGICYAYIQSQEDTNVYEIRNSNNGNILAYVEDETKEMKTLVGKYVAFYGELIDISVPMFIAYEFRGSGDYI